MSQSTLNDYPPRQSPPPSPPRMPIVRGNGARVLVVDDDPDQTAGLVQVLELVGFTVQTAHDGPSALEIARSFAPRAVVLDVGMPGVDGYEVARQLRKEQSGERMLLIAVTGHGTEDDRDRSREVGFDHHLLKPVNLKNLIALLTEGTS